jgi:WD40 repeat protein
LWDAATGECVATVKGSFLFAFSPDGSCIASIDHNDQTFRLLDAATGECVTTLEGHIADVEIGSVAFSPDGSRIAFGGDDKRVRVWDAATGECVATLEGHSGAVNSVAFSPDGSRIASGSDDRTVRVWNRLTLEDRDDSDVAS